MPIFEYQCRDCGTKFEKIVFSETGSPRRLVCKSCQSPQVTKLLSTFAVWSGASKSQAPEPRPCGACGAPRRGMCQE